MTTCRYRLVNEPPSVEDYSVRFRGHRAPVDWDVPKVLAPRLQARGEGGDMDNPGQQAFELSEVFVHLEDGGGAERMEVTSTFWQELASRERIASGWLVGRIHMEADTLNWEMHPRGEELLCLLSGAIDVVLDYDAGEREVELRAGNACLVPQGVWHRQIVVEPGDLLFLTYGSGTEHRPVEPDAA